jgi:hypothetical protein
VAEQLALDTPFVARGIPHISFWNGRILTAEDLREEQRANELERSQLGKAMGTGVVSGFTVSRETRNTHLVVTAGLAIDRDGQVIELPVDVDLDLVVPRDASPSTDDWFTACAPLASDSLTGTGLYLLTVRAASQARSTTTGIAAFGTGVGTECGPKYSLEGVSFRLIALNALTLASEAGHTDAADLDAVTALGASVSKPLARNVLAHIFLDTLAWTRRFADPFGAPKTEVEFGTLTRLAKSRLQSCEVPIAFITWTGTGVRLVDTWAARRPPLGEPAYTVIQRLGTAQRERTGRAAFAQFQDQLAELPDEAGFARASFRLRDRFRYLPAAGVIPIRPARPGFSSNVFAGIAIRGPALLGSASVGALLDESFHHAAIDLDLDEGLHVYAVADSTGGFEYFVFTTTRMRFVAEMLAIESVFPSGMLLRGQKMEIRGTGFGVSNGSSRVKVGGINTDPLPGSSDLKLVIEIPNSLDVAVDGSAVTLEVTSDFGSDSVQLSVGRPAEQQIEGKLHVLWEAIEPETPLSSHPVEIRYRVRSELTTTANVALAVDATAGATLHDRDGRAIVDPVELESDHDMEVTAHVTFPDAGSMDVRVSAAVQDISDADVRTFQARLSTPAADPALRILAPDVASQPDGASSLDRGILRMEDDATAQLTFPLEITQPGRYRFIAETTAPHVWRAEVSSPADPIEVVEGDIVNRGDVVEASIVVSVRRVGDNPPPGVVTLSIRRDGNTRPVTRSYRLRAMR